MVATSRFIELVPGVLVATSRNYATTTTALLDGAGGAVVVDPAWDPDELAAISSDLASLGAQCVAGLATHEHYDHVMWHPDLGEVPRWSSSTTVRRLADARDDVLAPLTAFLPADLIAVAGRLQALDSARLPWAGPEATCIVHDAHAPGHLAILVERTGVLIAGDMLSDVELPMPASEDTTLERYLIGLDKLRDASARAIWVIPGHGTPSGDPRARFDADLRYLDDLIAGRRSDDPRVSYPVNLELHQENLARATGSRQA